MTTEQNARVEVELLLNPINPEEMDSDAYGVLARVFHNSGGMAKSYEELERRQSAEFFSGSLNWKEPHVSPWRRFRYRLKRFLMFWRR